MKNNNDENQWIGVIPNDWKLIKGKYLFQQRSEKGNELELQLLSPTQKYGVIPQSLYEKLSGFSAVKLDEKTDFNTLKTIHKGDYCISLRSFQGGFEYSEYEGVCSPAYQIFFPIDKLCSKYYKYLFKDQCFIDKINSFTLSLRDGKNVSFTDFASTYLPYPPLCIQEKIADFLDKKCTEIDMLHSDIEKQIETLEEYKKSIITEAVTKGLDPDVEMKDSGIEWMGMVPSTWESNKVLNCIDFIGGSQPPLSYFEGEEKEGYVRLIQNRDYKTDDYMTFVPKRMVTKFCEVDDVMIGRYGPPLFVLHRGLKGAYNVAIMKAVPKLLDREFMAFYLQNYTLLQYIESFSKRTAGQAGVNTDILKKYPIYVPPMEEQKEIAIYLEKKCIEIDNVIGKKKEQLETLEQYKKSLIYEYVTGKKEVPDYE